MPDTCAVLQDVQIKPVNFSESHTAGLKITDDNVKELGKYVNNIRCHLANIIGAESPTAAAIRAVVRSMLMVVDIDFAQVDGTSIQNVTNGIIVTRNGLQFIVRHPDSLMSMLHNLRSKTNREYANSYSFRIDDDANAIITFSVLPDEVLQLEIFG